MRKRIFQLVEKATAEDRFSHIYDVIISVTAVISMIPLMFKEQTAPLVFLDTATVYILFLDYILRWMTHDFASKWFRGRRSAFVVYPITPLAILDLLSLLPSLGLLGHGFRFLRMFRLFKLFHYSQSFSRILRVFNKERRVLGSVLAIAVAYIFISALAMFSYEPDTFQSFFHALYWATTALTTVGYGDVYPITDVGRFISMISSLFGIAVIAMPAGIITSSFMEEISRDKEEALQQGGKKESLVVRIIRLREKRMQEAFMKQEGDEDDE